MEQANLVASSQREKQFRNRVIGAGVATLAILAPNSSPATSAESTSFAPAISASAESVSYNALATKTKKKKKLSCKKINKVRNKAKRPLKKKEKRFLKKKCGIKFPNIEGSTKNTKIYDNSLYNWGPKPIDKGFVTQPDGTVYFPDEMNIIVDNIYLNSFSEKGELEGTIALGMNPYYFSEPGRRKEYKITQPQPGKISDGQIIDTEIVLSACNESDESRLITLGLKTFDKSPEETIASSSFNMLPGECKKYLVSDSVDQPKNETQLTTEAYDSTIEDDYFVKVNPGSREKSLQYRSLKAATLFYTVNYDAPEPRYYQRGVLTGAPTTNVKISEYTKPTKQQVMNRGW
jgi:hypothetical protein